MPERPPPDSSAGRGEERGRPPDLWEVLAPACAAISLGIMAWGLTAIRQINPRLEMRFDLLSLVCGLAAGAAGWRVGRSLWQLARPGVGGAGADRGRAKRIVVLGLGTLGAVTVLGFVWAGAGLPDSRRRDVVAGSLLALMVLGAIAWVLLRLARLFGSPDEPEDRA